jgi:hypothetical protein
MVASMAGNKAKFTGNHGFYVLILFSRCPEFVATKPGKNAKTLR